jgi:hypothetical protein
VPRQKRRKWTSASNIAQVELNFAFFKKKKYHDTSNRKAMFFSNLLQFCGVQIPEKNGYCNKQKKQVYGASL